MSNLPESTEHALNALKSLDSAITGGNIEEVSACARVAFHCIYDDALRFSWKHVENASEILALFDRATQLQSANPEHRPHLDCIREKAEWVRVLFEQGDAAVHRLIRRKFQGVFG